MEHESAIEEEKGISRSEMERQKGQAPLRFSGSGTIWIWRWVDINQFRSNRRLAMAETIDSKVSYFLVGLGVGSLIGILFAPKSGEETREYLSQKVNEGSEYAQKKVRDLQERAEDVVERGKEVVTEKKEEIAAAVDVGRENYQREKSKAKGV